MNNRLLNRYLLREVLSAWAAVILVLLAIMVATRFASFLSMAAKGDLPRDLLLQVVGLSSLRYLVILMPASLLLGIMLSLGRLYSDNEIAAMMGCGVSLAGLYRPFMIVGGVLAAFTALLAFQIGPWAGREADFLVKDAKRFVQYTPFEPARFKNVANGKAVFYTSEVDPQVGRLGQIFSRVQGNGSPSFVTAPSGHQAIDPATGDRLVTLENGFRYEGQPGRADFEVTQFRELTMRISPPSFAYVNNQRKLAPTSDLLGSKDLQDRAEVQSRLGAPLSLLVLALLAVPLSHLAPRQSRYSKMVYGLLAFLIYANFLGIGQAWIAKNQAAAAVGLWPVHIMMLGVTLLLIARRRGLLGGR